MKHQTHQYRAERKAGLHKVAQKPEALFASEIALAAASISVQELLQSAMVKKLQQRFLGAVKQTHLLISNAKTKSKKKVEFRVLWPASAGTYVRKIHGPLKKDTNRRRRNIS